MYGFVLRIRHVAARPFQLYILSKTLRQDFAHSLQHTTDTKVIQHLKYCTFTSLYIHASNEIEWSLISLAKKGRAEIVT